jgi:hypothetical protein
MVLRDAGRDRSDNDTERRLTLRLCELVDSPRSLAVALLAKAKEWNQLIDLKIDPVNYTEAQHFADDYLCTELLRKSKTIETGNDPKAVAVAGFFEAEQACKETNVRFSQPVDKIGRADLIWRVGSYIRKALPPLSSPEGKELLDRVLEASRHGPGASTSVKGTGSVPSDKYDAEVHLTHKLVPFARALMGDRWATFARKSIVRGNRHSTVPKDASKDRNIAVEPSLNVFGQLGIGAVIPIA